MLQLRSKSYLKRLYSDRHLSIKKIVLQEDARYSVVHEALKRFGIPRDGNGRKHPGQIPFGYDCDLSVSSKQAVAVEDRRRTQPALQV